jgi:mRNA interferase RelE/StbE
LAWTIELTDAAERSLHKIDRQNARRIRDFIELRIRPSADPRAIGKATSGPLAGYWRYRVGDYRIICDIQDKRVRILVITIGDRKEVYR